MSADELGVRLQAGRVWHCYECGDDMPAKYQRTHPVLCLLAARLAARKVELLLVEVSSRSRRLTSQRSAGDGP